MLAAPKAAGEELLTRLNQARQRSDELFAIVRPDSLYERPIPERHRIVFYIGHLEAFDWNLLCGRIIDQTAFDPELDHLFAFGIDPVDGSLLTDQPSDWPSIDGVRRYVKRVRGSLDSALAKASSHASPELYSQLLNVGIEHRLMHAETLAYMLHQLSPDRKIAVKSELEAVVPPVAPTMITIPAGPVTLGLRRADQHLFGWDNEYEAHQVNVPAFAIDKYKITNRQFLEFL